MLAIGAKKLLQIIIGPGKSRDAIAVKQAGPVAPADLQKVPYRWCEAPGFGLMLPHGPEPPVQPPLYSGSWLLGVIMQDDSVSKVEMVTPMALIYKVLCSSISTFETPPAGVQSTRDS